MDPLNLIQLAITYGLTIKRVIDVAVSNEDLISKLKEEAAPVASLLETLGSKLFPKAAPALHIAAGAIGAFDPSVTRWLQQSLNALLSPSPNLTVDGIYGPLTRAAVLRVQTQLGLTVDGFAGVLTRAAIDAAMGKLSQSKPATVET